MKIVIMSKEPVIVTARTKYSNIPQSRLSYLHYNLKINDWFDFISYVKKYPYLKNRGDKKWTN